MVFLSPAAMANPGEPEAVLAIRLLNHEGVRGLDHLRLWGQFNDLLVRHVDRKLKASVSFYLTATAHGYIALVNLRKLLDSQGKAVSVGRLLSREDAPPLLIAIAPRHRDLRFPEAQLRYVLSRYRDLLRDVGQRAKPALKMVNRMIVHVDGEHVRDPERTEMRIQRWRVSADTLAGFYREAQWIVNGWDLAWSGRWAHWNLPANRDDFDGIRAALDRAVILSDRTGECAESGA